MKNKSIKLCSACLLGIKCRYDDKSKPNKQVIELSKKETLIPVCPEQLGGLSTPRILAEIIGKTDYDLISKGLADHIRKIDNKVMIENIFFEEESLGYSLSSKKEYYFIRR